MEYINTILIKPHPQNPRSITERAMTALMESLEENPKFLEARPIVVSKQFDESYLIIGGHQRFEALKRMGKTKVPCNVLEDLTPEQEIELMLRDNKASGTTNKEKLFAIDKDILKKVGIKQPPKVKQVEVPTGTLIKVNFTDAEIEEIGYVPTADELKALFLEV